MSPRECQQLAEMIRDLTARLERFEQRAAALTDVTS
jgi:hypothetical protein